MCPVLLFDRWSAILSDVMYDREQNTLAVQSIGGDAVLRGVIYSMLRLHLLTFPRTLVYLILYFSVFPHVYLSNARSSMLPVSCSYVTISPYGGLQRILTNENGNRFLFPRSKCILTLPNLHIVTVLS